MKTTVMMSMLLSVLPVSMLDAEDKPAADKVVVLSFGDSVSSHAEFVAPYLRELGFGATFFITEGFAFKTDKKHYMTWAQIKQLNDDGLEIGNHTKSHQAVTKQKRAQLKEAIVGIGHTSWLPAQRPNVGVMLNP
jgi:peptidoglycan/xylan/chitin deacetylase (PgdA/CDA1 family)